MTLIIIKILKTYAETAEKKTLECTFYTESITPNSPNHE
jgi:hypothetical protein